MRVMAALAIDRKKCVIVDLDGLLWPGVLAETGAPFNWRPDISSPYSYVGLYFGLHEALLTLKKRGILLACVSKNDEATVRELWKYAAALCRPAAADARTISSPGGSTGTTRWTISAPSPTNWAWRWRPSCSWTTIRWSATGCANVCPKSKSGARILLCCAAAC